VTTIGTGATERGHKVVTEQGAHRPADPSSPAVEEYGTPPAAASAESDYNRGIRARVARDWTTAEAAFREALVRRAAFPEAWNELGFALRNQGRFAESLKAYDEALRLRPDFPRRSSISARPAGKARARTVLRGHARRQMEQ
jgi:tetratricopeptide (TPR) repeat protein